VLIDDHQSIWCFQTHGGSGNRAAFLGNRFQAISRQSSRNPLSPAGGSEIFSRTFQPAAPPHFAPPSLQRLFSFALINNQALPLFRLNARLPRGNRQTRILRRTVPTIVPYRIPEVPRPGVRGNDLLLAIFEKSPSISRVFKKKNRDDRPPRRENVRNDAP